MTVIGEGIHVHGRVHGEEDLRIEGRIEGSISLTETVHVAQSGVVVATIEARDVVVSGVVVGNVSATNSVHLERGAKLVGDIDAPRLIIADGAAFRGNVVMGEGADATAASTAKARPVATPRARPAASRPMGTASKPAASKPAAGRPGGRPERVEARAARPERPAPAPRVAAIRPPQATGGPDEEVTVVVRHAALAEDDEANEAVESRKKPGKKAPPRGRVPKPGKRRVNRR
ncbi:bactofilin family protein [Paraliomyxa miuraensis]|uniref:bactofilin family protein n=1 Tax=Paraliomyxa miuraensis TaxID=376150 RepID=UPI002256651A|nr:polymer-forming cytoskeletal protein [Paraliomyxa miuraensis]MCX4245421.1 polymer-forming cytoskeletal protein [Paraliomyxa miuraensis]